DRGCGGSRDFRTSARLGFHGAYPPRPRAIASVPLDDVAAGARNKVALFLCGPEIANCVCDALRDFGCCGGFELSIGQSVAGSLLSPRGLCALCGRRL